MDVQGWLNSWASLFSAVGTVGALLVAIRLLQHEQRARREQVAKEEASTAAVVTAWWQGVRWLMPDEDDRELGAVPAAEVKAWVRNGSDQPVYDVIVSMPCGPHGDVSSANMRMLKPGEAREVMVLHRKDPGTDTIDPLFGIPSISFTDGVGLRWQRDHSGRLHREAPLEQSWEARMRKEGDAQDAWFATWAVNPFTRAPSWPVEGK